MTKKKDRGPWGRRAEKELTKEELIEHKIKAGFRRFFWGNIDEIWLDDGKKSSFHKTTLKGNRPWDVVFLRNDGKIFASSIKQEEKLYKKYKKRWIAWVRLPMFEGQFYEMDTYTPENPLILPNDIEVIVQLFKDRQEKNNGFYTWDDLYEE